MRNVRVRAITCAVLSIPLATAVALAAPKTKPKTAAKPKAKPAAHATAARAAATPDTAPAVAGPERKVTGGSASCKLGTKSMSFKTATGSFQSSGGFQIASIKFEGGKKGLPKLAIDFLYQGTGPVDPSMIQHLYAIDDDNVVTAMKPHVSTCTIVLARATPNMVEGTASCPKGMLNEDKPGRPITEINFKAEAQP